MLILKQVLLFATVCAVTGTAPASAEVFQWRDPHTQMTITFPDNWRQVSGQKPGDVLTVVAPGQGEFAECRVHVSEDRRFVVYPRRFADSIQRVNYSRAFWDHYIGQFAAAELHTVTDNAGLGNGFASWADASFVTDAGPKVQKRGLMFATVYNDTAYVLECSAEHEAYGKWHNKFLSVLKSVDMRPEYATSVNSVYRDFQNDEPLLIHGQEPVDLYVY